MGKKTLQKPESISMVYNPHPGLDQESLSPFLAYPGTPHSIPLAQWPRRAGASRERTPANHSHSGFPGADSVRQRLSGPQCASTVHVSPPPCCPPSFIWWPPWHSLLRNPGGLMGLRIEVALGSHPNSNMWKLSDSEPATHPLSLRFLVYEMGLWYPHQDPIKIKCDRI